jgi:HlyD family secretion protein
MKNIMQITLTAIILGTMAMSCSGANPNELMLSGTIEAETVHAGSRIGGRIADVMVDEGIYVGQGDMLFKLETDVLEAERERAEAGVREAEAAYATIAAGAKPEDIARASNEAEALRQSWQLALAGPLPEEIAALQAQADSLEAVYRNAEDASARMQYLYGEGVAAEREYIAAMESAEAARNQWQASLQQLDALMARPREEEVDAAYSRYLAALSGVQSLTSGATREQLDQALARIATTREALDRIDVDLAEATVYAPSPGVINSFDIKPGDFIPPGQAACEIIDLDTLKVIVYIPENRLGFVQEGDELPVKVDSYPEETFTGTVIRVASEAEFTPRNVQVVEERVAQVFAVEITLPNPEHKLRPGMAADVTISLAD